MYRIGKEITTLCSDALASQFDRQSILQEIHKVLHLFAKKAKQKLLITGYSHQKR
jgi:hypothetical protein